MHSERTPMRWVLVTGAAGGIGRASVRTLHDAGFGVFAGVRRLEHLNSFGFEGSDRVRPLQIDITDQAKLLQSLEALEPDLSARGLYGLVNNAGIAIPGPFECQSLADIRVQIEVNVMGTLTLTQRLLPALRAARGRIVVISSLAGRLGMPFNAVHCGSKHFLEGAFDALRLELKRTGVRTVIIEPGAIRTPMIEKFSVAAAQALSRIPQEMQPLYAEPLRRMIRSLATHIDKGSPAGVVADAVHEALSARYPRTRYAVGSGAKLMAAVAKLLPDRLKDRILTRFFNLAGEVQYQR